MLDHISLAVSDLTISAAFYDHALEPLRLVRVWSASDAIGYGASGNDDCFAIKVASGRIAPHARTHLAFRAPTRDAVRAFYLAARSSGAEDDGGVGFCPEYGEHYFAAFVRDPDGHRIEAVCHSAEQ